MFLAATHPSSDVPSSSSSESDDQQIGVQTVDHPLARRYSLSLNETYGLIVCVHPDCRVVIAPSRLHRHLKDHRYSITRNVVDEIRRVCVFSDPPELPPPNSPPIVNIPVLTGWGCPECNCAGTSQRAVQSHPRGSACVSRRVEPVIFQRPFGGGNNSGKTFICSTPAPPVIGAAGLLQSLTQSDLVTYHQAVQLGPSAERSEAISFENTSAYYLRLGIAGFAHQMTFAERRDLSLLASSKLLDDDLLEERLSMVNSLWLDNSVRLLDDVDLRKIRSALRSDFQCVTLVAVATFPNC